MRANLTRWFLIFILAWTGDQFVLIRSVFG
jgi:hypothetical protein